MSLYQIKNRAYDRMEKLYLYVGKNCEYLLSVFSEGKKCQKSLCFLKIRVLSLYALTYCFIRFRGMEVQEEVHI